MFTEVLIHVLSNCASRSIVQKLNLNLCPGCYLVERESRACILDLVSIGKPKFCFSFCLFGERSLESKTEKRKKGEAIEKGDYGPPTRKVCC